MEFTRIQQAFAKAFARRHARNRRAGPNPSRDWRVLLIVFCVATLGSLAFSMYLFFKDAPARADMLGEPRSPAEALERDGLMRTLDFFAEKERRLEGLRNSRPSVVDPSL